MKPLLARREFHIISSRILVVIEIWIRCYCLQKLNIRFYWTFNLLWMHNVPWHGIIYWNSDWEWKFHLSTGWGSVPFSNIFQGFLKLSLTWVVRRGWKALPPSSPDLTAMAFYFCWKMDKYTSNFTVKGLWIIEPLDTTNPLTNARYPTECMARAEDWSYVELTTGLRSNYVRQKNTVF